MKWSRLRKLTWKVLLVYLAVILLIFFADPDPQKYLRWWFWTGVGLLAAGEGIRIWASGHLVKNKELTVSGPYAYVKNPLYIGTFLCMIGLCAMAKGRPDFSAWYLRHLNWIVLAIGVAAFLFYYVPYKKKKEGGRLHRIFGDSWDHYDQSVPGYFPRWTRYSRAPDSSWKWNAARANSEFWSPVAIVIGITVLLFNQTVMDFALRVVPWA